jgi:hypothetical protein
MSFSFSTFDKFFLLLDVTLARSELEHASPVWNSITATDASRLERVQRNFAALCFIRFFPHISYKCASALENLKLQSLQFRRRHLDALFFIQVFL